MKIGVDLDGVVYDFHGAYRLMLREYRGVYTPPIEEWWYNWNDQAQWGKAEDHKWMWTEGIKLGLFRYGHVIKGAVIGLKKLADAGHDLIVITHRSKAAINDTLDFTRYIANGMWNWSGIHILTEEEDKSIVEADLLIDDKIQNIEDWLKHKNREAILFSRPWNIRDERKLLYTNANSWEEVCVELSK